MKKSEVEKIQKAIDILSGVRFNTNDTELVNVLWEAQEQIEQFVFPNGEEIHELHYNKAGERIELELNVKQIQEWVNNNTMMTHFKGGKNNMNIKQKLLNSEWFRFWILNQRCSKCRFVGDTFWDKCHNKQSPYYGYQVDCLEGDPTVCKFFERSTENKHLKIYTDEQFKEENKA